MIEKEAKIERVRGRPDKNEAKERTGSSWETRRKERADDSGQLGDVADREANAWIPLPRYQQRPPLSRLHGHALITLVYDLLRPSVPSWFDFFPRFMQVCVIQGRVSRWYKMRARQGEKACKDNMTGRDEGNDATVSTIVSWEIDLPELTDSRG